MTKRANRARISGFPHAPAKLSVTQMVLDEKDLLGIRANPSACKETVALIANGSAEIKPIISYVFPLQGLERAEKIFNERLEKAVKVIVKPSSTGDSKIYGLPTTPFRKGGGGIWSGLSIFVTFYGEVRRRLQSYKSRRPVL